jgi:hypothetical protein
MFRHSIPRAILVVATMAAILPLFSSPADARHSRRHASRHWHGYGFLPGYRPPEQIERERARQLDQQYWYGSPRFYHGRWNGGGFGPCWTQTPIGNMWNCGK